MTDDDRIAAIEASEATEAAAVDATAIATIAPQPDTLDDLIGHCTRALSIADRRGYRFLVYMLRMTLEAAQQLAPPPHR